MKCRYVRQIQILAVLVVMLAASATALHAQTYTVLYTFPIGSGNDSGTGSPQVMSSGCQGRREDHHHYAWWNRDQQ
jgi:hypothetical protein